MNPLVSIIIPVYNGSNFLKVAIESALAQTYENLEILVVNDGSTDDGATKQIAESYGDQLRYLEKINGGVSSALNLGINQMKGDYFSWLSHDDVYKPEKIARQIEFVRENNWDPKVLYSDFDVIGNDGHALSIKTKPRELHESGLPMLIQLLTSSPIHGCTVLLHKSVIEEVGLFNEQLTNTQDVDFWIRVVESFDFHFLPEKLIQSRRHEGQGTRQNRHHVLCDHFYATVAHELILRKENLVVSHVKAIIDSMIERNYFSAASMFTYFYRSKTSKYLVFAKMSLRSIRRLFTYLKRIFKK